MEFMHLPSSSAARSVVCTQGTSGMLACLGGRLVGRAAAARSGIRRQDGRTTPLSQLAANSKYGGPDTHAEGGLSGAGAIRVVERHNLGVCRAMVATLFAADLQRCMQYPQRTRVSVWYWQPLVNAGRNAGRRQKRTPTPGGTLETRTACCTADFAGGARFVAVARTAGGCAGWRRGRRAGQCKLRQLMREGSPAAGPGATAFCCSHTM